MYDYGWYAERHNWTPEQVDNLPAWVEARLPGFAQCWDQVMASRREA
jgi:hypothetical protein